MKTEKQEIAESLQPLFKEAREKHLWFFNPYYGIWFSPDELQAEHDNGKFVWGAVNWELREPAEQITEIEGRMNSLLTELHNTKERINKTTINEPESA